MALDITCTKGTIWGIHDLLREVLGTLFVESGSGNTANGEALRLMHVVDSEEPYFCDVQEFKSWDDLARKLVGIDGGSRPAVRVCIGNGGANFITADNASKAYSTEQLLLRTIGKATDGGPMIRINIANAP